jgi:hypothetical protein
MSRSKPRDLARERKLALNAVAQLRKWAAEELVNGDCALAVGTLITAARMAGEVDTLRWVIDPSKSGSPTWGSLDNLRAGLIKRCKLGSVARKLGKRAPARDRARAASLAHRPLDLDGARGRRSPR